MLECWTAAPCYCLRGPDPSRQMCHNENKDLYEYLKGTEGCCGSLVKEAKTRDEMLARVRAGHRRFVKIQRAYQWYGFTGYTDTVVNRACDRRAVEPEDPCEVKAIRKKATELAELIDELCPYDIEKSYALADILSAVRWTVGAIRAKHKDTIEGAQNDV